MSSFLVGTGFSPRNGEIILKSEGYSPAQCIMEFQSPQWGDNSKAADVG